MRASQLQVHLSATHMTRVMVLLGLCLFAASAVRGQYFTQPGSHSYSLNSVNQVFDVSPDGTIGISLKNDPVSGHPALLTTFDPILGTQMDSETFGFGPLGVSLAQVGNNLRAVVLTSQGGPRRIYLFDISSSGQLTQLTSTQLTTSNGDGGSNLVLSGSAQAGFVVVYSNSGADLVAFSLLDGAILNRLALSAITSTLAMNETSNSRVLAFRLGNSLTIVNALNPSQMTLAGNVPLLSNGELSGSSHDGLAFSTDGRFVFLGNQFYNFAAIDLNLMQVVGTIPGANYRFSRVRIFENGQQRLLAVLSSTSGTGGVAAILLVDATDPSHLSIVNQYTPLPTETFFTKSDLAFSQNGARLYAAAKEKLIAFDVPTFNKAWEQPVPGFVSQVHQLKVYGPNDEVLGAWDLSGGQAAIFGAFPAFPPFVAIDQSTTVGEGGGPANFVISLSSSAAPHQVIVKYATADGTATQGSDYTSTNGTVTFEPGVTTKIVSVPIVNDATDEFDETFTLNIQSASPGIVLNAQSTASILDDDPPPSASINDVSINEGNSGTRSATFFVSLSGASAKPISLSYATADDTATAGDDYVSATGTITFSPGQTTTATVIQVKGDTIGEGNETFVVNLGSPVNVTVADGQGVGTIQNDDATIFRVAQGSYAVAESGPTVSITVNRSGDLSTQATVDYSTNDFMAARCDTVPANASAKCDYATAGGQLRFAAGELSKSIVLPIVDDAFVEGNETLTLSLSNPNGAALGLPSTTTITIQDNDTNPNAPNPFLNNAFFVRQQYLDFLLREPDTAGFNDWLNVLDGCGPGRGWLGSPPACDRVHVSSGFFRSTEFGEKGYWIYRFFEASLGRRPDFAEFMPEMRRLSGLMPDVEQEARRADFIARFMQLPEFTNIYAGLTDAGHASQFIARLEEKARLTLPETVPPTQSGQPPQYGRSQLINLMQTGQLSPAQTLRAFIEQKIVWDTYFYRAFVAMQYFGYLRRDPESAGYDDWVDVLTNGRALAGIQPGDYRHLIFGFVYSVEYRERFGLP